MNQFIYTANALAVATMIQHIKIALVIAGRLLLHILVAIYPSSDIIKINMISTITKLHIILHSPFKLTDKDGFVKFYQHFDYIKCVK